MCVDVFAHFVMMGVLIVDLVPRSVPEGDDQTGVIAPGAVELVRMIGHIRDLGDQGGKGQQAAPRFCGAHFGIPEFEKKHMLKHNSLLWGTAPENLLPLYPHPASYTMKVYTLYATLHAFLIEERKEALYN
jgi:hypothetical protein